VKLDTVRLWLARSAQHTQQVNELLVKEIKVNRVELDELWSFVRKKNFRAWQTARKKRMGPAGSGSRMHQSTD
jgi:glutamate dehydrogenase/leucine dehydrogenase